MPLRFAPPRRRPRWPLLALLPVAVALGSCDARFDPESQHIKQLELKIQQLETRLNRLAGQQNHPPATTTNPRLPAGPVKSLTYRTTPSGNRLRIYWADGSSTDLECNQEQSTLACG